jgi:membrane-associated protease RseP (regulator of RpoE activity)
MYIPRHRVLPLTGPETLKRGWWYVLAVNLSLWAFNLLALPGLDGAHLIKDMLGIVFDDGEYQDGRGRDEEVDYEAEIYELEAGTARSQYPPSPSSESPLHGDLESDRFLRSSRAGTRSGTRRGGTSSSYRKAWRPRREWRLPVERFIKISTGLGVGMLVLFGVARGVLSSGSVSG